MATSLSYVLIELHTYLREHSDDQLLSMSGLFVTRCRGLQAVANGRVKDTRVLCFTE